MISKKKENKDVKLKMALALSVDYYRWPMGGVLTYVLNIIPGLGRRFSLELWGIKMPGETSNEVEIGNERYYVNKYATIAEGKHFIPNALRVFWGMLKNADRLGAYDVIFCHSATELIAMKLCLKKTMPFVAYVQHGLNYLNNPNYILKRFIASTGQYAQTHSNINFIVTDKISFAEYVKRPEKKKAAPFYQIGSPIDYEYISKLRMRSKSDKARFVFSGRFDSDKQPDIAIKAFVKYLEKYNANAEFYMLGGGPLLDSCMRLAVSLGVEKKICFFGRIAREDVIQQLYDSDVFVLPSVGEGMSLSSLEALAAGLPVVVFNVMGVRAVVENDINGYLVDELYDVDVYAECMNRAYINRERLSAAAVLSAKEYDREVITEKIYQIIMNEYNKANKGND